jgi:hypothetical protein
MVPSNRIPVSKRPPGIAPTSVIDQAQKLRDLASWYRQFAEGAGNSPISDARLRTAEKLDPPVGARRRRRRAERS